MERLGQRVPDATRSSSSTAGSRCSGRATPTTPRTSLRAAKKARPRHAVGGRRPTTCSTRSTSVGYPIFRPIAAEPRCSSSGVAAPGRGAPALGASASTSARRGCAPRRRRGAGRRRGRAVRQGQPHRVVLAPRAADAHVPAQPVGALLPRPAARVDGPARRGGRAVPEGGRARARARELGRGAAQFLDAACNAGGTGSSKK